MARMLVELGRSRKPSMGLSKWRPASLGLTGGAKADPIGIAAGAVPAGIGVSYFFRKGATTGDYILGAVLLAAGGYVVARSAKF